MNRILMMVLKNLHVAPAAFIKLWRYAANPEKYTEMEKWNQVHYIMNRAVMGGNIDLVVTGLENLPEKDGFMVYANHQGMFDVVAIAATCPVTEEVFDRRFTHFPIYGLSQEQLDYMADAILESIDEMQKGI